MGFKAAGAGHSAKRNRLTWLMAGVLVCLVGTIAYLENKDSNDNALPRRAADDVKVITVSRPNNEAIRLERLDDSPELWQITAPVQLPANSQRIIPLLTVYTNPDPGYAISSVDLDATGLNAPKISLAFDDYEVKIGSVAVDGSKRHALHGTRVRFVPDWVLPFLEGGVSALADLTLWGDALSAMTNDRGDAFSDEALEAAKNLVAQQYVAWPRRDNPPILMSTQFNAATGSDRTEWLAHATDRYVAIQVVDTDYAYIVPLDEVPWLFP